MQIHQTFKTILGLSIGLCMTLAFADDVITPNTPPASNAAPSSAIILPGASPNVELVRDLCPQTEQLALDPVRHTWSAPKGWKTTQPSFLTTVDSFVGAQWIGVSVGQVICIYTQSGRDTFPVTLQRGLLVPAPSSGGMWSVDKGGHMDCKSNQVIDCPFFVQIPKPVKNIYDELNFKQR